MFLKVDLATSGITQIAHGFLHDPLSDSCMVQTEIPSNYGNAKATY